MSNPHESALLRSAAYQDKIARGLVAGVSAFVRP
jgi:N-acetylmuramoyl-L-alanine amidase